ncbi:hypothetical protein L7F22_044966 [Adiantum nelumboides]|nr:hypothetical protein [Adiantum nelumboides]
MGQCYGKSSASKERHGESGAPENGIPTGNRGAKSTFTVSPLPSASPLPTFYSPLPGTSSVPMQSPSPAHSTPRRFFKRPFPPPSPAKHIQASLLKRYGASKPKEGPIPEGAEPDKTAERTFGYSRSFSSKYELGQEVGRGHFGHTCFARVKKGELKGQAVAVKVIAKAKMTTAISIEDVKREVKILRALSGHENLVQFYDACEDNNNVYIVMESASFENTVTGDFCLSCKYRDGVPGRHFFGIPCKLT